jgi:hypothetical protein
MGTSLRFLLLALHYIVVVNAVSARAQDRQAPAKEPEFFNLCLFGRGTDASIIPLAEQIAQCSIREKDILLRLQKERQHSVHNNEPATTQTPRREP